MWKEQATLYGIDPLKIKIEKQRQAGTKPDFDAEMDAIKSAIISQRNTERFEAKIISDDEFVKYISGG